MLENLGRRIRQLREFRKLGGGSLGCSRACASRIELGRGWPSLGLLERICETLTVSPAILLGPQEQFDRLFLEDEFIQAVQSFLKSLNAEQRAYILKVLAAAPVMEVKRRYGRTKQAISRD
jgi:transcriptional regulator with XRE-family HTH domain